MNSPMTDNRDDALRALADKWEARAGGMKLDAEDAAHIACARELRAALLTQPADSGCVMVPREPTPEMIAAFTELDYTDLVEFNYYGGMTGWDMQVTEDGARNAWAAMIAATPKEQKP